MLTAGAGGVLLGKYLYGPKTPQVATGNIPTPRGETPIATPIIDTTTNWKAYTNTTYEYTLEYPDSWIEKIKCEGGTQNDDYMCFISPDFTESSIGAISGSTTGGGLVWIDNKGDLVGLSPRDFCNSSSVKIKECKEISVSGMKAMKRTWNSTTQVGIVKNDKVVISFRVIYNEKSEKEILVTFDQILSTFRFLD